LLVNEGGVHPARLVSVLHFDGTPITARFIIKQIREKLRGGRAAIAPEKVQ
jgi:2-oxoglutarate ferredoxin oxidoreductase subunit alpha